MDRAADGEFAFVLGALVGAVESAVRRPDGYPPHGAECVCSMCDLGRALNRYNEVAIAQNRYWPSGPRWET